MTAAGAVACGGVPRQRVGLCSARTRPDTSPRTQAPHQAHHQRPTCCARQPLDNNRLAQWGAVGHGMASPPIPPIPPHSPPFPPQPPPHKTTPARRPPTTSARSTAADSDCPACMSPAAAAATCTQASVQGGVNDGHRRAHESSHHPKCASAGEGPGRRLLAHLGGMIVRQLQPALGRLRWRPAHLIRHGVAAGPAQGAGGCVGADHHLPVLNGAGGLRW